MSVPLRALQVAPPNPYVHRRRIPCDGWLDASLPSRLSACARGSVRVSSAAQAVSGLGTRRRQRHARRAGCETVPPPQPVIATRNGDGESCDGRSVRGVRREKTAECDSPKRDDLARHASCTECTNLSVVGVQAGTARWQSQTLDAAAHPERTKFSQGTLRRVHATCIRRSREIRPNDSFSSQRPRLIWSTIKSACALMPSAVGWYAVAPGVA
jgi:hypothetical protein